MPSTNGSIRILTAVPICDGHDSAINTINLELIRAGVEVIYLGYHRSARDMARAAIQEDVRAVGISSYNGGHVEFFAEVAKLLRQQGAGDIRVFGGGGGTITEADGRAMLRRGVDRIFFAGTPLDEITGFVLKQYGGSGTARRAPGGATGDLKLSRQLSQVVGGARAKRSAGARGGRGGRGGGGRVIGVTGPGGAGKTTLIDELVLRALKEDPHWRIAILSHDPSILGPGGTGGALLGDRAAMIYSQNDRVFMRSLATRGQPGGVAAHTRAGLEMLRGEFDLVFVETVGIGQESAPLAGDVDVTLFVMSPEYGSRLQLQKIVMLDRADIVVVNKSDQAGAKTARAEVEHRLLSNHRGQRVIATQASLHADRGVDELFALAKEASR